MPTKIKKIRPDGGLWLGPKLIKLAELKPLDKVFIEIDGGLISIKATGETATTSASKE